MGAKVLVLAIKADKEMCNPAWDTPLLQAQGSENWNNTLLCQTCLSQIIGPTMWPQFDGKGHKQKLRELSRSYSLNRAEANSMQDEWPKDKNDQGPMTKWP